MSGVVDRVLQLSRRSWIFSDLSIGSIALLPSSIQLLRCTAEAVRGPAMPGLPAMPLVGELWWSARIRGSLSCRRSAPSGVLRGSPIFDLKVGSSCNAAVERDGGDEETRTPDPLLAKEMLCQLSYVPVLEKWWAHLDSNQGPRPYQGRALTS